MHDSVRRLKFIFAWQETNNLSKNKNPYQDRDLSASFFYRRHFLQQKVQTAEHH